MNGVNLELTCVDLQEVGVHGWVVKADAVTALKQLRTRGLNASRLETFHPARTRFRRLWVIGRPDQIAEFTWLMAVNGTRLRGRLYDGHLSPARWVSAPASLRIPATFSHLTKTVSGASRHERYRAKSNGVGGGLPVRTRLPCAPAGGSRTPALAVRRTKMPDITGTTRGAIHPSRRVLVSACPEWGADAQTWRPDEVVAQRLPAAWTITGQRSLGRSSPPLHPC